MKNILLIPILTIIAGLSKAATITVVTNNGDWQTTSTWDLARLPASGDVVNIPSGKTVVIGANVNLGSATLTINDYGTINFTGSHKIVLGAASIFNVYGGGLISNVGGVNDFIQIGAARVWDQTMGNVVGPKYATAATGAFVPFVPLAVKFASFSLSEEKNGVVVQWATTQEQNASFFDVERSEDGIKFTSIGRVSAAGTTSTLFTYSFDDKNLSVGTKYYRIKEVDKDGQFDYTEIKVIKVNSTTNASIQITCSNHNVILQFPKAISGNVIVRVISFNGQVIIQQLISNPAGQIVLSQIGALHGNYIVCITNDNSFSLAKQVQF